MKIVVMSDSHGNIANLKLVLGFAKKINAGALIHSGDWDNSRAVEETLLSGIPLYAVLGNADIDTEISNKLQARAALFGEKFLKINLDNKKIGIVHNIKDLILKKEDLDIVFCGHKHFKSEMIVNEVRVIAPGALHSPGPSFVVYETDANRVEFFDL